MRITAKIAYTGRGTKRIYTNQSTQIQSTHLNGSNFANLSSLMLDLYYPACPLGFSKHKIIFLNEIFVAKFYRFKVANLMQGRLGK